MKERFKKVESYHVEVPEEHRKWVDVKAEGRPTSLLSAKYIDISSDHGTNGPLHLSKLLLPE